MSRALRLFVLRPGALLVPPPKCPTFHPSPAHLCTHTSLWGSKKQPETKWGPKGNYDGGKRAPELFLNEKEARKWVSRLAPEQRLLLQAAFKDANLAQAAAEAEAEAATVERPSPAALRHLAFHQALPFVGFGFLDNLIMILAGEYIDHTIGVTLGISTMAAAALGNTISDVFGVGSAWYVEHFSTKFLGATPPPLSLEQLDLSVCRITANAGRGLGVAVGCVLGMAPLLFQ